MHNRSILHRGFDRLESLFRLNVRGKLTLLILCILIPVVILDVINIGTGFRQRAQGELEDSRNYAEAVGIAFTNFLDEIWDTEAVLGAALVLEGTRLTSGQIEQLLKDQLVLHPTVSNFLWTDADGFVLASAQPGTKGSLIGDRDYVRRIVGGAENVVSDVLVGRVSTAPSIAVARGIHQQGRLVGIMVAGVEVNRLGSVLPAGPVGDTTFGLVDRQGVVAYRTDTPNLPLPLRTLKADSPIRRALAGEVALTTRYMDSADGTPRMGAGTPVSRIGWAAFATTPVKNALSAAWADTVRTIAVTILVISISLVGVWLISTRLVRPISDLHRAALAISRGDLSARAQLSGRDELATMAGAFNRMAEEIQSLVKDRDQRAADWRLLAERDPLTGLYNHRTFQMKLSQALAQRRRSGEPVSLLMIDIDCFKNFNDTYGHPMGDEVLRIVARTLQTSVRDNDSVCRYGGEEFAVILPDADRNRAHQVAERLRLAVAASAIPVHDAEAAGVRVTISIGAATHPDDATDRRSLIANADKALYQAKDAGRNRVELYGLSLMTG